jgi:hypothetical protein
MKNLQTFENFITEESVSSIKLSSAINKAIMKIDDSMSYEDFAIAVAKILIDQYGEHNYEPFMKVLHNEIGMKHTF